MGKLFIRFSLSFKRNFDCHAISVTKPEFCNTYKYHHKKLIAFTSIGPSLFYTPEEQSFLKVSASLSPLPVNMLCIMKG